MATATLNIVADVKKAVKSLDTLEKTAKDSAKTFESSFSFLKGLGAAVAGAFAFQKITQGIGAVTDAAARQEAAVNSLNQALAASGEFSIEASEDMQAYASSIQQASVFGDELVLEQLALAKSFGATNEQAKQVVSAATELAAATGKSLNEATRQVAKTLGGFAGELGEVNPNIKALTAAQLQAGEAAKILIAQYGGSALAQTRTFSGAIEGLSNAFGDFLEFLGGVLVKSPAVIQAITILRKVFEKLPGVLSQGQSNAQNLLETFIDFSVSVIPAAVQGLGLLVRGFSFIDVGVRTLIRGVAELLVGLANLAKFAGLKDLTKDAREFADAFDPIDTVAGYNKLISKIDDTVGLVRDVTTEVKSAADGADSITDGFTNASEAAKKAKNEAEKLTKTTAAQVTTLKTIVSENEKLSLTLANQGATESKVRENNLEFALKQIDAKKEELKLSGLLTDEISAQLDIQKELITNTSKTAAGGASGNASGNAANSLTVDSKAESSITDSIVKGFDTGSEFISNAFGGFSTAFDQIIGGGLFNSISGVSDAILAFPQVILDSLGQFLEEGGVQKIVDGFSNALDKLIDKLPQIFSTFIEGFTGVLSALIDRLPEILTGLFNGLGDLLIAVFEKIIPKFLEIIPEIISGILKAVPRIIKSLLAALPQIVESLIKGLVDGIVVIAENIGPIVDALVFGIVDALPRIVTSLIDELIISGGLLRIALALAKALIIDLPIALASGFVKGIISVGQSAFRSLGKVFSSGIKFPKITIPKPAFLDSLKSTLSGGPLVKALEKIVGFLQSIGDQIAKATGQGGGGVVGSLKKGDVVGAVDTLLGGDKRRKILGFAEGGLVPSGFPADTFPARLTSGEFVVDNNITPKLSRFLDSQENGTTQPVQITLKLGEQELADVIYGLNRRGFKLA